MLRAIRRLLAAVGFLLVLVMFTPLVPWWARRLAGPWHDPTGDVLVVLGAAIEDRDVIGLSSYWRSVYGVLAWREGGFKRIIVTGGGPKESGAVAPLMRQFMIALGVPESAVEAETASNSTRENALFVAPLLKDTPQARIVLMTSDYHMFRALRVFGKAGLSVQPRPLPDLIKRSGCVACRWNLFAELLRETAKIGYYWARGWI